MYGEKIMARTTFSGPVVSQSGFLSDHATSAAINATAVATAAEVATGYITSTSAAGTSITFPTGTLLGLLIVLPVSPTIFVITVWLNS